MEQNRLKELEEQCIQECAPPCTASCPVHVNVRQMASAAGNGDFANALKTLRKSVPFPEIIARTCDQPCQAKCTRNPVGGAIQIADIELACVQYGSDHPPSIPPIPRKADRVAVIGGGLCGLTAAFELHKKGYQVSLIEKGSRLGGRLRNFPESKLSPTVIDREINFALQSGFKVILDNQIDSITSLIEQYDAVFLACGDQDPIGADFKPSPTGKDPIDPLTLQTSQTRLFAGGTLLHAYSTIQSIADGKRAAISIDRFLQKVSLTASRANEGSYDTKLYTSVKDVDIMGVIAASTPTTGYTSEEARAEAKRCLQCECLECVKVCEYLKHYGSYPRKYVREIYNNLSIIMRTRTANKFINSCTLCGLCAEVCPSQLDMGAVNLEARQEMVDKGKMPISAHDFALRDMAFSNSERFAASLIPTGQDTCNYALFPGCQLAASDPGYIQKMYEILAPVFPGLGVLLRCCGAPAEWAGEKDLFAQTTAEFRDEWQKAGNPKLILACSSCNSVFKKYMPEVQTISLWEIFEQHHLWPVSVNSKKAVVIHDPCTSRYEPVWQNAVRHGLGAMGIQFHELKMSRTLTECCGYGGVAWLAHPELVKDIIRRRINEDPADYLTYCVMCRDLFAAEGKPTLHLLDLLFGVDLETLAARRPPDHSQRHENRMRVKQQMTLLLSGKDRSQVESYEKYQVILSPELRSLIESRLILVEDIQKVIQHAEETHETFINQENGHKLASFKPNLITYWVEYTTTGEKYQVYDAYSHRMNLTGDGSR